VEGKSFEGYGNLLVQSNFMQGKEIKEACINDYLVIYDTGFFIQ
jgi:hypothetical protein